MAPVPISHLSRYVRDKAGEPPHPSLPVPTLWLIFPYTPQFTAPSMASVLEQLNVINGILFIPLR